MSDAGAYGFLLLRGSLHFGIDVMSQYLRGKRAPGPETTLYYGLNSAYALGQILFALLALLVIRSGVAFIGDWAGISLGLVAAAGWPLIGFKFLEYPQPRIVITVFAVLLIGAAVTG